MVYPSQNRPQSIKLENVKYKLENDQILTIHHITHPSEISSKLLEKLNQLFNEILIEGRTYPIENELDLEAFTSYYCAYDLFVGLLSDEDDINKIDDNALDNLLAGCYYVKPNYIGRSSHLCNAGFIVNGQKRGQKLGSYLGKSYLHFGPKLGYKGSVFNLVYKSNVASLKIWDSLGFTRAGLIPNAGRLRSPDGSEYYDDAVIFYKDFTK